MKKIENIVIRKFKRKYLNHCSKIMKPTWNLSVNLPLVKNPDKICFFIMKYYFLKSSYKIVALNDNQVLGFITADNVLKGFCRFFYRIKSCLNLFIYRIQLWFFLLFKKHEEKYQIESFFNFLFTKKTLPFDSSACTEIVSLFVNPLNQGLGLGRKLLNNLLWVCKKNKIDSVFLFTDTDCNYKYYDYLGFKRIVSYKGTIGINSTKEDDLSFLYKLDL